MKAPYIAYPPPSLLPPTPIPTTLSIVLFLWLNGWSCHLCCAILLNIMDLHMLSLGTLVSEGPSCKFYATRRQVYWGLKHMVFCWYSDLISQNHKHTKTHTQRHTAHPRASRLTHPYKYLHHLFCAHSSYLYYTEWLIHWYQKFIFHNVFSLKKLFTCKSHISVD